MARIVITGGAGFLGSHLVDRFIEAGDNVICHTDHKAFYVRSATTDGNTIVYHAGADLYAFDVDQAAERRIDVEWRSPRTQRQRKFVSAADYLRGVVLHPEGHSVAVTTRGKPFTMGLWEGVALGHGEPDGVRYRLGGYLHDGKRFLIDRYALAVTPGLDLTDPRPIETEDLKLLLVGLSESSQGFPPLQHITEELKAIQGLYGGKTLLNENFLLSSVEETLQNEPFNIVHIATHGKFESDVEETFLLTFDDKLTLDRLDQCVGFFRFREDPLELLTLSACQTAAGDDRAALGLAGVAVKAGARSAFATLWYINDQASSILVSEFYRQLLDPAVSRAVALQRAQLKLLKDLRYEHPGYWSPFLLINNWL